MTEKPVTDVYKRNLHGRETQKKVMNASLYKTSLFPARNACQHPTVTVTSLNRMWWLSTVDSSSWEWEESRSEFKTKVLYEFQGDPVLERKGDGNKGR